MNLEQARAELLAARAEIEARLDRTHKHIYNKDEPVSAKFSEQIKETENDALVQALEQEGQEELKQINRALERLEQGKYQTCSGCGKTIPEARLKAIPFTELCIRCASKT